GEARAATRALVRRIRDLRGRGFAIKMALIALAFTVPIVGFSAAFVHQQQTLIELTSRERIGLGYSVRNETVLHALRKLRDRVAIDGADGRLERLHVQSALNALYAYNSTAGRDLALTKRLARFQMHWASVAAGSRSPEEIDATIISAERLFYYIDEHSYLSADRDTNTAELIDALGTQLPAFAESINRAKVVLLRD